MLGIYIKAATILPAPKVAGKTNLKVAVVMKEEVATTPGIHAK